MGELGEALMRSYAIIPMTRCDNCDQQFADDALTTVPTEEGKPLFMCEPCLKALWEKLMNGARH